MSIESVGEPVLAVSMLGRPCLALDKRADPLTHATVIHLRLDYLPHALMFMPLAPLRRLGFPRHSLRLVIPAGLALAIGLEGVQYLLPYRAWNVNDAIGNGAGVLLSPLFFLVMRRPRRCGGQRTEGGVHPCRE